MLVNINTIAAMDLFEVVNETYGVDPDEPIPVDDDDGHIVIPQTPLKFRSTDLTILHQQVNPLGSTSNYGIDLYEETLNLILTFTPL